MANEYSVLNNTGLTLFSDGNISATIGHGTTIVNGTIGINTSTPTYTMEIDGDIRISSKTIIGDDYQSNPAYIATIDGGYVQVKTDSERYLTILPVTSGGGAVSSGIQAGSNGGANNRLCLNAAGGFVSVNNSYAGYNLDVTGNLNYSGTLTNNSDSRIKTNITTLNETEALQTLRQIETKKYTYIDTEYNTDKPVYGFIAQQIKDVIPNAVKTTSREIPSIMTEYSNISISQDNIDIEFTIPETFVNVTTNNTVVAKLSDPLYSSIAYRMNVTNVTNDTTTLTIAKNNLYAETQESLERVNHTSLFLYGEVVNDFHVINKNAIFTVTTAAVQELDSQVQNLTTENNTLKTQLATLESRIYALETSH